MTILTERFPVKSIATEDEYKGDAVVGTQTDMQLDALDNATNAASQVIDCLEGRLTRVIREEPPSTDKEPSCGPAQAIVPLADSIRKYVWRIEEINSRLIYLVDHLEI